jgi:hypothetical protein
MEETGALERQTVSVEQPQFMVVEGLVQLQREQQIVQVGQVQQEVL